VKRALGAAALGVAAAFLVGEPWARLALVGGVALAAWGAWQRRPILALAGGALLIVGAATGAPWIGAVAGLALVLALHAAWDAPRPTREGWLAMGALLLVASAGVALLAYYASPEEPLGAASAAGFLGGAVLVALVALGLVAESARKQDKGDEGWQRP